MTPTSLLRHGLARALLALLLPWQATVALAQDKPDFSAAERLLLMSDQLRGLRAPSALSYRYSHRGSLDEPFQDQVTLHLGARADGSCCSARGDFLSGARKLTLPEVDQAQGNPVVLYFLERDIREMNRLTQGSVSYFRKRIRMALYESATVRELTVRYRGQAVPAREIVLQPYLDDPNQARFAQHTGKRYRFVLSESVPGQVVALHTLTTAAGGRTLAEDELLLDGAESLLASATAQR